MTQLVKRVTTVRHRTRRGRRATGALAKKIRGVVKAQLSRVTETKRLIYGPQDRNLYADEIYYVNPIYSISVGSGYTQREGNMLSNAWLNCSGQVATLGTNVTGGTDKLQQIQFRIMVVKCNQQLSTVVNWATTTIGAASFPNLLYNDYHLQSTANRHDYQVLYSRVIKPAPKPYPITAASGLYGPLASWNFNVKLGNLRYEDTGGFLKGNQIYILIWAHSRGATTGDTLGAMQSNYAVTWKDP